MPTGEAEGGMREVSKKGMENGRKDRRGTTDEEIGHHQFGGKVTFLLLLLLLLPGLLLLLLPLPLLPLPSPLLPLLPLVLLFLPNRWSTTTINPTPVLTTTSITTITHLSYVIQHENETRLLLPSACARGTVVG